MLKILIFILCGMVIYAFSMFIYSFVKFNLIDWNRKREQRKRIKNTVEIPHKKGSIKVVTYDLQSEIECFPMSIKDIDEILVKAEQTFESALEGIDSIHLCDRSMDLNYQIFGSYTPNPEIKGIKGAMICLFPLEKDAFEHDMFRFYIDSRKEYYLLMTKEEARDELLFTLGHELGHNLIYNRTGKLFGEKIEEECDQLSRQMGSISLESEFLLTRDIYKNNRALGTIHELEGQLF